MSFKIAHSFTYTFNNHFHPFVSQLLEQLNKRSIDGLLNGDFHATLEESFFEEQYQPAQNRFVKVKYFPKQFAFQPDDAYAIYHQELLLHAPLSIAVHLSKNQRFAEAQRWFHYIFDPTTRDGQFWRFLGFRQQDDVRQIDELLKLLGQSDETLSASEQRAIELALAGYDQLRDTPFQSHAVARTRSLAYQYCVVMKYLDNLIDWGDSLFRQDTIETLNEATQIYVLAANLLGEKPERIPERGRVKPKTFAQLKASQSGIDQMGNALVALEGQLLANLNATKTEGGNDGKASSLFGIGRTFYFCIPHNEKLLGYWDTVADRLFKIRHCMNMEGIVRQLPLFQPPLDPGMLVRGAAAGIDISGIVGGINRPMMPIRSTLLIQKALEICSELRGMGNSLLSALEKQDGEALGLLRQKHEINIQQLTQDARFLQWKEAEAATESLLKTRQSAVERYLFYKRLLGVPEADLSDVTEFSLERRQLTEDNFDEIYADLIGQYGQDIENEAYPALDVINEGKLYLNYQEDIELNQHLPNAARARQLSSMLELYASAISLTPDSKIHAHYWGVGVSTEVTGGQKLAIAARITAEIQRILAAVEQDIAGMASRHGSYERRADDWRLQCNLAARELVQIGRQIISSLIREQITRHDYESLKVQIEQAKEVDQFLHDKFTSRQLYGWMQGELSKLHHTYYKFAFDIARRAEQTVKHELMRPELDERTFVKFSYWDGGRKGLLAGETLNLDLKRLEMAYHEHNKREYELTKHISLRQLNPLALLNLKQQGRCEVALPEWLFDLETHGHYMRRIKHVSLSIPAVTGPYTSINCTLTLQKSSIRHSTSLDDEYGRLGEEDNRFIDYYGAVQSIVTSSGQNDSGLFEPNLRDERFLPFEGHGIISHWKLELPSAFRQFDYKAISDVSMHVHYTARQAGSDFSDAAIKHTESIIESATGSGLSQLFSLQHDFPTEWHRFVTGDGAFSATVAKQHFPYFTQGKSIEIVNATIFSADSEPSIESKWNNKQLNAATPTMSLENISVNKSVPAFVILDYILT